MEEVAFAVAGIINALPDIEKEFKVSQDAVVFDSLRKAKKAALAMARKERKPFYVACSSGSAVVQGEKLFRYAGYYVARPDGSFRWEK